MSTVDHNAYVLDSRAEKDFELALTRAQEVQRLAALMVESLTIRDYPAASGYAQAITDPLYTVKCAATRFTQQSVYRAKDA